MNLDAIKQQTTWNDAATSINSNFAKLLQAILALEGGGGNEGGGLDESQLEAYLIANEYTTQAWVLAQKFLKEITSEQVIEALQYTPLNPSDADAKYAPLAGFNTLQSDFDALNAALNDDVSGKINTWNEIVDFVDEYSGSEDLATIISGINAEVNKRLLISTYNDFLATEYNPLKAKVGAMEADIDTNTTAIQAVDLKVTNLGNHMTGVDETIVAIQTQTDGINERLVAVETWKEATDTTVSNLSAQVSTNKTNIEKLLGWFRLDSSENLYTDKNFYSTKEISSNGLGQGTGGSGGSGMIESVLTVDELGTELIDDNKAVFNAFATNKVYNDLVTLTGRVDSLSTVTSAVGWSGEITSGKKIGTLTINGLENYLYAPATYAFSEITGKPTTLSGYGITDKVVKFWNNVFTPAESELSAQAVFEAFGKGTVLGRSGWAYNENGYLTTPFGAIDLAGVSVIQWKGPWATDKEYTQLYITASTSSGTANAITGEMLYYVNNGDIYSPTWYRVLTDKNYSKYALPLSGGRIDASVRTLYLNLNSTNPNVIEFMSNGTRTGFLGIRSDGSPLYMDSSLTQRDLLHSGNIGDYAIYLDKSATGSYASPSKFNTVGYGNGVTSSGWHTIGPILTFGVSGYFGQFQKSYDGDSLFLRSYINGTFGAWKTIAFTDSNVASATKLAAARIIWGQSFDGTGNVTGNLKVGDGYLYLNNNKGLYSYGTDGVATYVAGLDSSNNYLFGHGQYAATLRGKTVSLAYGTSHTTGFIINSSGNVTIGSTDLAGTSAKLYVDGASSFVGGRVSIPANGDRVTFNRTSGYSMGILAMNTNNTYIEAPLKTDSSSGAKTPIMIGWRDGVYPFYISASGNIGIGTTTNISSRLTIAATTTSEPTIAVDNHCKILGISNKKNNWLQREILSSGWDSSRGDVLYLRTPSSQETSPFIFMQREGLRVGINTENPEYTLDVDGTISAGATTLSSLTVNGGAVITSSAKINEVTYGYGTITFAGNIQINPTASGARVYLNTSTYGLTCTGGALSVGYIGEKSGYKFYVRSGNAYVEGNIAADGEVSANVLNTGSDIRFKNRISDVVLDLDTMANAPMFRFTWNNRKDDRVYIGSSAQYWKGTSAKELVSKGCDDFHRLDYSTLGAMMGVSLAKKAKNHEGRIKELEMKVESLEQENRRLRYGN